MKYKINRVEIEGCQRERIGLFSEDSKWEGRGNFCGWYGVELYTHGTLLAYYEIDRQFSIYSPKGHKHHNNVVVNEQFEEMMIGSGLWEDTLEAENDEEAIKKFFKEDFHHGFSTEQDVSASL